MHTFNIDQGEDEIRTSTNEILQIPVRTFSKVSFIVSSKTKKIHLMLFAINQNS